jgi:hypothetical protein
MQTDAKTLTTSDLLTRISLKSCETTGMTDADLFGWAMRNAEDVAEDMFEVCKRANEQLDTACAKIGTDDETVAKLARTFCKAQDAKRTAHKLQVDVDRIGEQPVTADNANEHYTRLREIFEGTLKLVAQMSYVANQVIVD